MRGGNVLVVDDDPYIRRLVTVVLEHHGLTVFAEGDGGRALVTAMTKPIDVVLLDVSMPILDGPGFVDVLRRNHVDLPIIVMSGVLGATTWAYAIDEIATLFKPFSMTELLAVVQAGLARAALVDTAPAQRHH
jgi:DNA-binding response OmpR family regulator